MSRVLVIEDDASILEGLVDNLRFEGYEVAQASDGDRGYALLSEFDPDLVILDLMLPRLSGYEVCRKAREAGIETPILMLTARGAEADRVLGLDLGADDYVAKPFSVRELMARVRALMRRSRRQVEMPGDLRFDAVEVDFLGYSVTRDGDPVAVTPKELGLLRYLVAKEGQVVNRNELLDHVWGYQATPTTRTVDNHVASLRAKLELDPSAPRHLKTVHGVGYKWVS